MSWDPSGPTVVQQLERWMRETPDAPAILWDGGALSYGELDARSARLAAHLRELGVGPDLMVAVIAERSAPQLVGLIAVLRAGGAYVPIKPDWPADRIAQMLDETAPVAILSDRAVASRAPVVRLADDYPARAPLPPLDVP